MTKSDGQSGAIEHRREANLQVAQSPPAVAAGGVTEALRKALDMCERYAEFIRRVPSANLEEHPYLPELEDVIEAATAAAIERLVAERDEARRANERDRTIIIDARNAIHDAIIRRSWLLEGRGSYEWDDERYQQEFSAAIEEIGKPLELLERLGIDWTNCPTEHAEIARARQALKDAP